LRRSPVAAAAASFPNRRDRGARPSRRAQAYVTDLVLVVGATGTRRLLTHISIDWFAKHF
jgi:hypothetical protein